MHKLLYVYKINYPVVSYIYLPIKDRFDLLPEDLKSRLSVNNFVIKVLTSKSKLNEVPMSKILTTINLKGYYCYIPPAEVNLLEKFREERNEEN